jgi:hypothetical protein
MNPINVAAEPLYKIARRFYSKSCGFTLLNRVPFGNFDMVNIYPPLEGLSAVVFDEGGSITQLRSGRLCEPPCALARLEGLSASGGDPHARLVPP